MASTALTPRCRGIKIAATMIALAVSSGSWSARYSLESDLGVNLRHNDNIRFSPTKKESLHGYTVNPRFKADIEDDNWGASLDIDMTFGRFNRKEYNSDDQVVLLEVNKKTERHYVGATGRFVRDSTRTSEVDTSGVVTASAERREYTSVSPAWTFSATEHNTLTVGTTFSQTEYYTDDFIDSRYKNISISWNGTIDDTAEVIIRLIAAANSPDERQVNYFGYEIGTSVKSISYELQVGGKYLVTKNLTINGSVGSARNEQKYKLRDPQKACEVIPDVLKPEQCNLEDYNATNFVADLSASWKFERGEANLSYSLQNSPSSQGFDVRYENYVLGWGYKLSEKSDFRLGSNFGKNRVLDGSMAFVDSDSISRDHRGASVGYYYRLTEHWKINLNYNYKWQDKGSINSLAESNSIILGISYRPTALSW